MSDTTTNAARTNDGPDWLAVVMISVVTTTLLMGLMLLLYDRYRYQPIVSVDVDRIMQQKMDSLQRQLRLSPDSINREQMSRQTQQWAEQLSREVKNIAQTHNAVVLVRPAVVEGSLDMTDQVLSRLK